MSSEQAASAWIEKLDALAEQANKNLAAATSRCEGQSDYGIGQALLAIASQLQYGNAVAAAAFYIQNRLWIIPAGGEE